MTVFEKNISHEGTKIFSFVLLTLTNMYCKNAGSHFLFFFLIFMVKTLRISAIGRFDSLLLIRGRGIRMKFGKKRPLHIISVICKSYSVIRIGLWYIEYWNWRNDCQPQENRLSFAFIWRNIPGIHCAVSLQLNV